MSTPHLSVRPAGSQVLLPLLIAIVSCAISATLTLRFCLELRESNNALSTWIAVAIGLVWEAGKVTFAPVGLRLISSRCQHEVVTGLVLCGLAGVLMLGSIGASLGYLVQADGRRQQEAVQASRRYQDRQAQIATIDGQLRSLVRAADQDSEEGYRTRAATTQTQIAELRRERARLSVEVDALEATAGVSPDTDTHASTTLDALFLRDAVPGATRLRFVVTAIVALMLELLSVAAIWLLRMQSESPDALEAPAQPPHPNTPKPSNSNAIIRPKPILAPDTLTDSPDMLMRQMRPSDALPDALPSASQIADAPSDALPNASTAPDAPPNASEMQTMCTDAISDALPDALVTASEAPVALWDASPDTVVASDEFPEIREDVRYQQARDLVATNAVRPSYRAIQQTLKLGQGTAKRFLEAMAADGVIARDGHRYVLATR